MSSTALSVIIICVIISSAQSQCNTTGLYLRECTALYRIFRNTLFNITNDDVNLLLLNSVFYPATRITQPVLVKVTYQLNINPSYKDLKLDFCLKDKPSICYKNEKYTFGWTSREIYRIFHPEIINQLRFQLPFWLLQVSENSPLLGDDNDVEALLWDGTEALPSLDLSLNIDLSSYKFNCRPTKQLIEQALGELNLWLRAFAKVSQRDHTGYGYAFAIADDKGITLHCSAVENYGNLSSDLSSGGPNPRKYGRGILIFSYTIGFVLTFMFTPLLLPLGFKIIQDLLSSEHELDIYYNSEILASASTVCLVYMISSIVIAFYQLTNPGDKFNEFDGIKAGYMVVLLIWLFLLTLVFTIYFQFESKEGNRRYNSVMKVIAFLAAFSFSAFSGLLMLSFAPIILLIFAYPIDTSSLLALHFALFYSTIMVLAVFYHSVHDWMKNHGSTMENVISCLPKNKQDNVCMKKFFIYSGTFFLILTGMIFVALLPMTYACLILLYQFVVARSGTALVYGSVATYVPSIIIAVFGFAIKKGAFDVPRHKKMEQQKENDILERNRNALSGNNLPRASS